MPSFILPGSPGVLPFAAAEVFDYTERFYNLTRRHSTLGYLSPVDFAKQAAVA